MPQINNFPLTNKKSLELRKSESDTPLQNSSIKNNELNTNQISHNSSIQVSKALTFSPTIPNKPSKSKCFKLINLIKMGLILYFYRTQRLKSNYTTVVS